MPKKSPSKRRASRLEARPAPLETRLVEGILPDPATPRRVTAEFRRLFAGGAQLCVAGDQEPHVEALAEHGDLPRHRVHLFGFDFYLTDFRKDHWLNFLVGFVAATTGPNRRKVWPRIFYKDPSLVWRVASHFISTEDDHWIGKGALRWEQEGDHEIAHTAEETTDLPYELQHAFDLVSRARKCRTDEDAVHLYLRRGGAGKTAPYADFERPREKAMAKYRVNRGRAVARFRRRNDPTSLVFAAGYEPDLSRGVVESTPSGSKLYGGALDKVRVLSVNREIQYQFVASPTHVFVNHPQALTTELSTYGVRTVDVIADERAFLPGFEYHFLDDSIDPPELYSQIPPGFAGSVGQHGCERADASPWIENLPVIREFRRKVLGERGA